MTNTKKAALTLGTIALVAAPIATVVSCGDAKTSSKADAKKSSQTELQKKEFSKTKRQVEELTRYLRELSKKLEETTISQKKEIQNIKSGFEKEKEELKRELEAKIAVANQELKAKLENQNKQLEALKGSITGEKRKKLDKDMLEAQIKLIQAQIAKKKTFVQTKEIVAEINRLELELKEVLNKLYGNVFVKKPSKKTTEEHKKQLEKEAIKNRIKAQEEDRKYLSLIAAKIYGEYAKKTSAEFLKNRAEMFKEMHK